MLLRMGLLLRLGPNVITDGTFIYGGPYLQTQQTVLETQQTLFQTQHSII